MAKTDDETLSRDLAFDILSNRRRRYALHYLSRHPEGVTLQTLAKEIAAWENNVTVESLTKKQQKRVYVSLHQTHIPKLEEAEVVHHDDDTGKIVLTDRADHVTTYLRADQTDTDVWYRYYLALVAISIVVFGGTVLGIPPLDLLSPTVVGVGIILAFGALTVVYFLLVHRDTGSSLKEFQSIE